MRIAPQRFSFVCMLLGALTAGAATTTQSDRGIPIVVTDLQGEVDVRTRGSKQSVSIDADIALPSRIVTGADGMIGLTQSRTSIAIAQNSDVEIPEAARDGQLIARLIQHRGNVFYDVEPREADKLQVDTPFLTAVVKGTQFQVVAQPDSTTISLFEGVLEIRNPDGTDVIELNAGQIAIRSAGETGIRVLDMDQDEAPIASVAPADGAFITVGSDGFAVIDATVPADVALDVEALDVEAETTVVAVSDLELSGETNVSLGSTADLGVDADADLGAGTADLGLDSSVDLGGAEADLGLDAAADLGAGTVDLGLDSGGLDADAGLDLSGDGSVLDVGLDAGDGTTAEQDGLLDTMLPSDTDEGLLGTLL